MAGINDYSNTPASNTTINTIDVDEGCNPANINNAIRQLMADIADVDDGVVPLQTPDINGGAIDGATIGGTTPGAATFTTASATTFSGSGASLTNIPNSALDNSSITINGTPTALGGSIVVGDITGVTAGTGLSGGGTTGAVTLNVSGLTVNELAGGSLTTSAEAFADNDTTLMTSAAINDRIESFGYTTNVGDITGVTAGTNLTGGGTSGTVTLNMATGGIGAGTYGSTADATKIDTITVDAYGRVTAVATGATGDLTSVSFDDLANKTSGTGDYATTADIVSGKGSGGVALTINDGHGNANVTWNHQNGVPEQNGNAARIEVNTDSTTNATMNFEIKSNVTSGSSVSLSPIMSLDENGIDVAGTVLTDKAYIAEATLTDGATISWNMSTQSVAKVTLGGNRTLAAPTNGSTGQFATITVIQDGTGSRTLTWNGVYEFKDDTAPTLTTTGGKGDVFVFKYNGSKWLEIGRNLNLTLS